MTYATTFSGIGGWELGLNACGWELKWQCEREPFCQALLRERFGVPIYDDIRTICDAGPEYVDAIIGSPPCQPFSFAGPQRGTSDERHPYPSFIKLVGNIKPRWVLMENVPGLFAPERNESGRIIGPAPIGAYLAGLAALGFDCVWHCIPASAVGAAHIRDRLWIIAYAERNRRREGGTQKSLCRQRNGTLQFERGFKVGPGRWRLSSPLVCGAADGVPNRSHRLKGLGNAVVPQIPYLIGQAINQIEGITC